MPKDYELSRLFEAKQAAWQEQDRLRQRMNDAWEASQRLQNRYGSEVTSLKDEHDRSFDRMREAYEAASRAFDSGDHDEARLYADRGKDYKAQLPELAERRRQIIRELEEARSMHIKYRDEFREAKRRFIEARDAFNDRQTELRAIKENALSIAAIPVQYRENAVLRNNTDGSIDVFFGGIGDSQMYHGHYHFESNGEITYRREPFQDHGPQNFRGNKYSPENDNPQTRRSFRNKNRNDRYEG